MIDRKGRAVRKGGDLSHFDSEMNGMIAGRSERRKAPRVDCHFIVRYQGLLRSMWRVSLLKDLGRGGARLVSEDAFEPRETMELRLRLPHLLEPVQVVAKIVWQKPVFSGAMQMTELGIAFDSLDAQTQQAINGVVRCALKTG
jgi:hypothetical protein